jgi:hypothetical protein
MFARDQRLIADMVQPGSDGWLDWAGAVNATAAFTVLCDTPTVQSHIDKVVRDGENAATLNFATRGIAVRGVLNGDHIAPFLAAKACMDAGDIIGAHCALMLLPGIGLPKAAFVLQMIWGAAVCIDSENEELYGVKAANPGKKLSAKARRRHVEKYHAMVADDCQIDSAAGWDNWCEHIAVKFNNNRVNKNGVVRRPQPQRDGTPWTADAVSALHPVWVRDMHTALRRMAAVRAADKLAAAAPAAMAAD